MRKLEVLGRLGGDPEVKTTKNGTEYTTFRIASQEYGESEATWFSITVWDKALQGFCKTLHKGNGVLVDGDYSDRQYTSTKTGKIEIGRDIRAHAIYYGMLPAKDDDSTKTNTESEPSNVVKNEAPKTVLPTQTQTVQDIAPTTDNFDDDLPF